MRRVRGKVGRGRGALWDGYEDYRRRREEEKGERGRHYYRFYLRVRIYHGCL